MLRYYFSKVGMAIAGETAQDREYARRQRRHATRDLLDELHHDLPEKGFSLRHNPMDEDGRMALFVSDNTRRNLVFLFTLHAECGELLEMTGRKAAFHIESAVTRKTGIFYAGDPKHPETGISGFLAHTVTTWAKR